MEKIETIRNEAEYETALARISDLMDALSGLQGQIAERTTPRESNWIHLSAKSNNTRTSTTRSTLPAPVRLSNSKSTKPALRRLT